MMKKSAFGFCDFSWNPVTGCLMDCPHCFAMSHLRRFAGDIRINKGSEQLIKEAPGLYILPKPFKSTYGTILQSPVGTTPTLHEYRLPMVAQKKKPAVIIVCSYADLFGAWVPDEWIRRVFEACEAAPWHNYLFLTKNPQRLCDMANAGWLPKHENWWYGTSVTKKGDRFFGGRIGDNIFISIEPLMGSLDAGVGSFGGAKWIIVGAETGNRRGKVAPQREWIENIIEAAGITHAAVLLKDSKEMRAVWGDDLIQQFPATLQHGKEDGK